MRPEALSEFELIARFFAPLAAAELGALGLLDDAATIQFDRGHRVIVTTDTIVSGIHFLSSDPPDSVAAKALAVNLSDLAAMGAVPRVYTLSLMLPRPWEWDYVQSWADRFAGRLAVDQAEAGIHLVGGDTVASPGPLSITVTALGMTREGEDLRRSNARPGDLVYVSGTIGDAALGLKYLSGELPDLAVELGEFLVKRYQFPEARIALGRKLVGVARSAADVSDGLVADARHICVASDVSITIDASRVPLSLPARTAIAADADLFDVALTGGDDYELVFTVPPASADTISLISSTLDTPLTPIGRVHARAPDAPQKRVVLLGRDGLPIDIATDGYRHF
jgi:thiamine-monophosphate kinase